MFGQLLEHGLNSGAQAHPLVYQLIEYAVGNVDYLSGCFRKVGPEAGSDQLVTFTGCLNEAWTIHYRDLLSTALDQSRKLQLPGSIRNARPLHPEHFGEQTLGDRQCVIV